MEPQHGYLLVVEDDALTRESMCEMLAEAGYTSAEITALLSAGAAQGAARQDAAGE